MKACIVQPFYSRDHARAEELFRWEMEALDRCDESLDLIVFPESCDQPALVAELSQHAEDAQKYGPALAKKAAETAARCNAVLCINMMQQTPTGPRNSTVVFDRTGAQAGRYDKQHLVPSEQRYLDTGYTRSFSAPYLLEIDGVKYGFLTCYDNYFYELFANMARFDPDVIIACSHQRSDTPDAIATITKFCAYNCNAYVVRASVSLGADSPVGGCSMIVAPDGTVLADLKNEVGSATAEFDPHRRYLKPAGFGNPDAPHHHYIESGREPWKYRQAGSAIVPFDDIMPYPRICAHRGFNSVAPENSLPAFGAAVALGAEELELDLWQTADGEVVTLHDGFLDRVSDGTGHVTAHTYAELLQYDFGSKYDAAFAGMKIPRFEDVLRHFAGQAILNLHIKEPANGGEWPEDYLKKIVALIDAYDCRRHCYFMSSVPVLQQLRRLAPDIARCTGDHDMKDLVDKALLVGAKKIQLCKSNFEAYGEGYVEEIIPRAHANGLRVNLFWSDDPAETAHYLRLGVDTILTNDYWRNAAVLRAAR